jgi:hypothetical protein
VVYAAIAREPLAQLPAGADADAVGAAARIRRIVSS